MPEGVLAPTVKLSQRAAAHEYHLIDHPVLSIVFDDEKMFVAENHAGCSYRRLVDNVPDFFAGNDSLKYFWKGVGINRLAQAAIKTGDKQFIDLFVHDAGGQGNDRNAIKMGGLPQ